MLSHGYDRLIIALAIIAGGMIAAVFLFIIVDVSMRTLGFRPPEFVSAVSEYLLLYMTMLAAPWLVRERGHVRIGSFLAFAPTIVSRLVDAVIVIVCAALCGSAAFYAFRLGYDFWQRDTLDIRSIAIPRWMLFAPLVIGFSLCAVEFLRFLSPHRQFTDTNPVSPVEGEL